jgi:hypothetical protein
MITQNRLIAFTTLLLFTACVSAQTWDELSPKEKQKTQRLWSKLAPTATLSLNDSSITTGQILFSTDSGIVWRSVPQYLPYGSDNIQLISYREINGLQTNRRGRLGQHVLRGGFTGAIVGIGLSYFGTRASGAFYPEEGILFSIAAINVGLGAGLIGGVVMDQLRSQRKVYAPDFKTVRRVGALYRPKRKDFWRKYWTEHDSLIEDYSLPPNLDKIRPFYNTPKFELSGHLNASSDFNYGYNLQNAELNRFGDGYEMAPHTIEFRLSYRLRPWLKAGILTHKTETDRIYIEMYHNDWNLSQYGSGSLGVSYERTFGLYTEYVPFPVKYLTFRNWEPFLGVGMLREKGRVSLSHYLDYTTLDREDYTALLNEAFQFQHPTGLGFMGLRVYVNRILSFEAQLGRYFSQTLRFNPVTVNFVDPYPDIVFKLNDLKLSRNYLSFSTSVRL